MLFIMLISIHQIYTNSLLETFVELYEDQYDFQDDSGIK